MIHTLTQPFLTLLVLLSLAWGAILGNQPVHAQAEGPSAPQARTAPLIIDHTTRNVTLIPQAWIEKAKTDLRIYYGHTSHGSQLMDGMDGLVAFANNGGLGLNLPDNIFDGLSVQETSPDAGYYPDWVNNTRTYLGTPNASTGRGNAHPEINVVIWSWCGQLSSMSQQTLITNYLTPMSQLEIDYPGITFVYMTGHSDGSGEGGNLHLRNQQIRQYASANNKVLYDFYDIELYDSSGNYFGNKAVNDNCDYDSDGNGSRDENWCTSWQAAHTQNVDWYSVSCAHSQSLNCNQKAYTAWWLWARIAGWDGNTGGDTQPPSAPTNLTAQAVSFHQVNLIWSASSDDTAVTGYRIYRDGVQIGTSTTASYSDTTVSSRRTYSYTVAAYDGAGNLSALSTSAPATTPAAPYSVYLPFVRKY